MNVIQVPMRCFASNCYLLVSESNNCAIVDPGYESDTINTYIKENNLIPKIILLTHGHFDHVGAVEDIKSLYNIPVAMNLLDLEQLPKIHNYHRVIKDFSVDIDLNEQFSYSLDDISIRVIPTPGHTKGSVCIICDNLMFSGDTLFNGDIGRTDLFGGDFEALLVSLAKLNSLDKNYKIYPGHEESGYLFDQKDFITQLLKEYK